MEKQEYQLCYEDLFYEAFSYISDRLHTFPIRDAETDENTMSENIINKADSLANHLTLRELIQVLPGVRSKYFEVNLFEYFKTWSSDSITLGDEIAYMVYQSLVDDLYEEFDIEKP